MNIPKSPSLQLLRRLHHQPLGFNDVSLSNENDWESESTIIHRHSVSGSSRTSRCSSVLSCALDWEEVDKEISLPNFIEYKTNEKPNWDFTDEMQRFKSLSDDADNEEEEEEEEQQDETIMSEGNLDLEIPKDDEEQTAEEVEAKDEGKEEDDKEENMSPLNRYQRELAKRIFVKNFSDSPLLSSSLLPSSFWLPFLLILSSFLAGICFIPLIFASLLISGLLAQITLFCFFISLTVAASTITIVIWVFLPFALILVVLSKK